MLTLGSGDPTRAIGSTPRAQAFQSIRYPILPIVDRRQSDAPDCPAVLARRARRCRFIADQWSAAGKQSADSVPGP
ncbi:hypothetical protein CDN99_08215 [Roseateles aquatilis]|uniref:Uncharacterized protein n=1 Tax=Roseateles aquatilis TaxID=431061 RepID=A0A246JET2_9BURK|nr:hypothetical protein CDN99_08215 [Roseateles aquatilis]